MNKVTKLTGLFIMMALLTMMSSCKRIFPDNGLELQRCEERRIRSGSV